MTGCNIVNHPTFAFYASSCSDPTTILAAENNWWGVTDSVAIEEIVFHFVDYATAPIVDFMPCATELLRCECAGFCDMNLDGGFTPLDVTYIVKYVYRSQDARPQLFNCPMENGDWDCSGDVSPLDVTFYVNKVYRSRGDGPCAPCGE